MKRRRETASIKESCCSEIISWRIIRRRRRQQRLYQSKEILLLLVFFLSISTGYSSWDSSGTLHSSSNEKNNSYHRNLQTLQQCKIYISIADSNPRNNLLEEMEYVNFLNRLSGDDEFEGYEFQDLPSKFTQYYSNLEEGGGIDVTGSKPGQTPTADQAEFLQKFCDESKYLLSATDPPSAPVTPAPAGSPTDSCDGTIETRKCYINLSIASRDSRLTEEEYVVFVNRLTDNNYEGLNFEDLPGNLKDNFYNLAQDGTIDITGSKPGQSPSNSQETFLASVCCQTDLAWRKPTEPTTSPPGGAPTIAPAANPSNCDDTISRQKCNIYLSIADLSKDDYVNKVEYIRFLDRLSGDGSYSDVAFEDLPENIIANFEKFAETDEGEKINIYGSKPGQSASSTQDELLDAFCCETDYAVQNPGTLAPASPTVAPFDQPVPPTPRPTVSPTDCRPLMRESDFNQDNFLNQEEFVRFVNRLSANEFQGFLFEDLPCPLPETYDDLRGENEEIYISGVDFMLQACSKVSTAIAQSGECQEEPTAAPTQTEVYNSFIISNNFKLTVDDLQPGNLNRDGLDRAYAVFVRDSVDLLSQMSSSSFLRRRRRKLEVLFQEDSAKVTVIVDSDCPTGTDTATTCQTVFASFQVKVENEDSAAVSEQYTTATQREIESGALQAALNKEDPKSVLTIVDASYPVVYDGPPTTPQPTRAPTAPSPAPEEKGSSNAASVVGGLFGFAIVAIIGWYVWKNYGKRIRLPSKRKGDNLGGIEGRQGLQGETAPRENLFAKSMVFVSKLANSVGQKRKVGDEEDDNEEEDKEDGEDRSDDEKENDFGTFGVEEKDDPFEEEKPEEKQGTKNIFGFGKKNKQAETDESSNYGAGSVFSENTKDEVGFGNYAFDDPSGSVSEKQKEAPSPKENIFDSEMSPAWGNNSTGFFGQSEQWGANSSNEEVGNSFFVSSTFSNNKDGKLSSGNQEQGDALAEDGSSGSSSESSYPSSGESTYESNSGDDHRFPEDSYSTSDDGENSSEATSTGPEDKGGAWGVQVETVTEESMAGPSGFDAELEKQGDDSMEEEEETDDDDYDDDGGSYSRSSRSYGTEDTGSTVTSTSDERRKRAEYRAQVDALVRLVLPDEITKVDAMMDQFKGREAELVSTLQTMQERSATQRARAAVHKSKSIPSREETRAHGSYAGSSNQTFGASEGSGAASAAIAAASLPIPQGGFAPSEEGESDEDEGMGFGDENAFGSTNSPFPEDDGGDGSFYTDDDLEDDYEDDEASGSYDSGSFEEEGSGSFAEDESFVEETEYDEEEVVSLEDNGGQSEIWN